MVLLVWVHSSPLSILPSSLSIPPSSPPPPYSVPFHSCIVKIAHLLNCFLVGPGTLSPFIAVYVVIASCLSLQGKVEVVTKEGPVSECTCMCAVHKAAGTTWKD